uniref:Isocitrate dehydrogenase (NAD(+)) 3 non-catalytic subunit gamma n=1 Tax=Sinocyclocheilus anshuiensis TaxID=1608454 RepID=A0A671KAE7_9TELE
MIPGDGIGPELLNHIRELFRFCCVPVDFEVVRVDSSASSEDDINNAVTAIKRNGVALKGEHEQMVHQPQKCLLTSLDLYASVMHCQSLSGVPTCHKDIDVFIIRENTEGEYSSVEHENVPGVVESLKIITRVNSLQISEYVFNLAREKGRRKVTAVHKANIMKLGDGLFLQCCKEVAAGYPEITFDNMIVDNTTMQLVTKPQHNVCAGLVGGSGLVPGVNYGKDYAVFETRTHEIFFVLHRLLASCLMVQHLKWSTLLCLRSREEDRAHQNRSELHFSSHAPLAHGRRMVNSSMNRC